NGNGARAATSFDSAPNFAIESSTVARASSMCASSVRAACIREYITWQCPLPIDGSAGIDGGLTFMGERYSYDPCASSPELQPELQPVPNLSPTVTADRPLGARIQA